jgi:hypothetical protein
VISVGLGRQSGLCDVTVQWPDGNSQTLRRLKSNRSWMIVQHEQAYSLSE